jgi:hypothetical protein
MKNLFTLILLLSFLVSFSQKSPVFEDLQLNENMRLIGIYPHYDEKRTYENYNFLIEDSNIIDSISKIIVKGKEVMNQSTRQEFTIRLYDGDKKVKSWSFDPKYKFIRIAGKSYEFDANQILALTEKYGIRYNLEKRFYNTQKQFNKDSEGIKANPNLLFVYKPNFKYEGTFDISYAKTGKFKHPKAISKYLDKKIGKFRKEKEYRVYYVANDFNRKNPNQYTMTIESDFGLYELFEDNKGVKKEWKAKEYSAYIFLKN